MGIQMTEEQKRLYQKLLAKGVSAPSVALEAEIKAVADRIALLEAVRQRAIEEEPLGPVIGEWIKTNEPQIVNLRTRPPT